LAPIADTNIIKIGDEKSVRVLFLDNQKYLTDRPVAFFEDFASGHKERSQGLGLVHKILTFEGLKELDNEDSYEKDIVSYPNAGPCGLRLVLS
jgi:hypothetical protein